MNTLFTVGHSTRKRSELVALLKHFGVDLLFDIRSIPYSGYNPQFNREEMEKEMPRTGIAYEHIAALGGKRPSQEVIAAAKSCSERSHGFAGYMETEEFKRGLDYVLMRVDEGRTVALMCAESDPAHCHRFHVADAVQGRGYGVQHIVKPDDLRDHPATLFTY